MTEIRRTEESSQVQLDKLLSEIEWRVHHRRMPEAIARLRDLEEAVVGHLGADLQVGARLPQVDDLGAASIRTDLLLARALLWTAHSGFRLTDEEGRTTLAALADLRELLAMHTDRVHAS